MRLIVGITGASGAVYGYTLVRMLSRQGVDTSIICTDMGKKVLEYECGISESELNKYGTVLDNHDLFAAPASGSFQTDGMVIAPCSMNSLGAIANGMGDTLLNRCASVALKEGNKLVLMVRETPYSMIHLDNMLKLSRAGGCILPASPGFYKKPKEIWELVSIMVMKVFDQFHIEYPEAERWGEDHETIGLF